MTFKWSTVLRGELVLFCHSLPHLDLVWKQNYETLKLKETYKWIPWLLMFDLNHNWCKRWTIYCTPTHNSGGSVYESTTITLVKSTVFSFLRISFLLELLSNVVVPDLETHTSFICDLCIPMSSHIHGT